MRGSIGWATTCHVAGAVLTAFTLLSPALAETRTFNYPVVAGGGNLRLDWCYDLGSGCGKRAADAWCVRQGFNQATTYARDDDIGARTPTRMIGNDGVCNQSWCDGFAQITCHRASAAPSTAMFNQPFHGGLRLDWCLTPGSNCGQPAATAFCRTKGHRHAAAFQIHHNIGVAAPTRAIGNNAVCAAPDCDGFLYIECSSVPATGARR